MRVEKHETRMYCEEESSRSVRRLDCPIAQPLIQDVKNMLSPANRSLSWDFSDLELEHSCSPSVENEVSVVAADLFMLSRGGVL